MESILNDGGPAFPVADYDHQTFQERTVAETRRLLSGMSLRDYLAATALQGICASGTNITNEQIAAEAYAQADAMLAARKEGGAA